jgi:hypothetical protein
VGALQHKSQMDKQNDGISMDFGGGGWDIRFKLREECFYVPKISLRLSSCLGLKPLPLLIEALDLGLCYFEMQTGHEVSPGCWKGEA